MRVTIPLDLSTWSFIPLPLFFHSRLTPPLLRDSYSFPSLFPQLSVQTTHDVCSFFLVNFTATVYHSSSVYTTDDSLQPSSYRYREWRKTTRVTSTLIRWRNTQNWMRLRITRLDHSSRTKKKNAYMRLEPLFGTLMDHHDRGMSSHDDRFPTRLWYLRDLRWSHSNVSVSICSTTSARMVHYQRTNAECRLMTACFSFFCLVLWSAR